MNPYEVLSKMTLEEKIALCSGKDVWTTKAYPQYGVEPIMMADGPHGLRKQECSSDILGVNPSVPATCFPTAVSTACSFDEELLEKMGQALGRETLANGVSVILGPGANMKRNPLCGRNFEYFSEDPYLAGKMAAAHIRGVESTGAMTSLKHFACNNQEYKRFSSDSIMDERTLREIYLTGFEIAVKEGKPSTVMCSYNKINGVHASDNKVLLTDILRDEWGFEGMVVTDWGATSNRIKAFEAGCDLGMPGGSAYMEREALEAVKKGELSEKAVDRCALRVLQLIAKGLENKKENYKADMEAHYKLACRVAEESAVLLKNRENLLPLDEKDDVVFVGHMAKNIRYQGTGSSHINPWKLKNVRDVMSDVAYAEGCDEDGDTSEVLLKEAIEKAKNAKVAVVFAGLTDKYESEGFDREHMKMPEGHNRMIEAVADANPNTVVVLLCGSAVELPWEDKVKSILYMGLPGCAGGEAVVNLLCGKANPSGKLAETWPYKYEDCVNASYYIKGTKDARYREGVYVGYRYYDSAEVPVRYRFGYGLSYTTFVYSDMEITGEKVRVKVTNTGNRTGKEVVQLYIAPPKGDFYRPKKELKAFRKIELNVGESKVVEFELNERSFAIWNDGWVVPGGDYEVIIEGHSSQIRKEEVSLQAPEVSNWYFEPKGIPSHQDFEKLLGREVKEKQLKKGEFTMENTVLEMKEHSWIMKVMAFAVETYISKDFGWKKDYNNPQFRMVINTAIDASLSGMKIGGRMKNYLIEGMLEIANGHFLKGIRTMLKRA